MIEKIGPIKNPLTIIAIFAGIAEVSGTTVLPFIAPANQLLFIYFLIVFPLLLIILFFLTLNFNNKVLYAPSDFKDEANYIKVNKYDISKQEYIQVEVKPEETSTFLLQQMKQFKEDIIYKISSLEKSANPHKEFTDLDFEEPDESDFSVSNMPRSNIFIKKMRALGYIFDIYGFNQEISKLREHEAIWLGKDIEFNTAKTIITESKEFYTHLKYIHISGDLNEDPPPQIHHQVFIGGATSSAIEMYKLKAMTEEQFKGISNAKNIEEIHSIIRQNYLK